MFRASGRDSNRASPVKTEDNGFSKPDVPSTSSSSEDLEIDNSEAVLQKISTLYGERLMNDICLVVAGSEYPAHRLILCASSEVFQVMLMNPEWSESQESRVVLLETPACASIFGDFLRYFYTGRIRINHLTVMPILLLADKYNVKDLVKLCINYMCVHIAHAAANNQLVSWLQYTLACGHNEVAQACQNFVKWNLELVADTPDFGNFEPEVLASLLQQNDLVVHNEMTLYNCVVKWLELQRERLAGTEEDTEEHMEQLVIEVMEHVRFPMMSPRQLADLLLSPLTKMYKEFFVERMAIGMYFHSGQTERIEEVLRQPGGRLRFTPRLYTADTWSTLLSVENFTLLPPYHTRTLVFSSHSSLAEHAGEHTCEWVVDLYPKGVWFKKFYLIVWQGTVEVPESVLRTVRLSVMCKDPPPPASASPDMRVKVGILIRGVQDGVEHVMTVIKRNHRFSEDDKVLNFDDLLSFDELNNSPSNGNGCSPYLVGRHRDVLKVHIVIAPLSDLCSTSSPPFAVK